MTILTDPDDISQGALTTSTTAAFSGKSGDTITITGTADLPALTAGDYFEIRDADIAANSGLYVETGGTPGVSSITADKVDGVPPENDAGADTIRFFGNTTTEKVIHYDVNARKIWLLRQGDVVAADGIDGGALYSKYKIDWKDDDDLNKHPFPCFAIDTDAGKYLMGTNGTDSNGWAFEDTANNTRELIRNAGWSEQNGDGYLGTSADGTIMERYSNITTLGSFEDDANDTAYWVFGDDPTTASNDSDFVFAGPVNEVIQTVENITPADAGTGFAFTATTTLTRNDAGNWLTEGYLPGGQITIANANESANDGTWTIATLTATVLTSTGFTNDATDNTMTASYDNRNAYRVFNRIRDVDPTGKLYAQANLADGGLTALIDGVNKFGLATAGDPKITETDANIGSNEPYTEVRVRYLAGTYNREVDSGTPRDFGIIVDVGTYSRDNGDSNTSTLFESDNHTLGAGEALADYAGGTLYIHEGTDEGTHTISGTPVDNSGTLEITLTVALTATEANLSFTMDRATPLAATAEEIHEKAQYQIRQDSDIDETDQTVIGKVADQLTVFDGDNLRCGTLIPTNPNGGGTGVLIEGFDANDTNRVFFIDNGGTSRNYPFVAAGNLIFSQTLIDDGADDYKMYFEYTERFVNTGFGLSAVSGATATLDSSVTDLTAELSDGDYIKLDNFDAGENDGIYVLTGAPAGSSPWTAPVRILNGVTLTNEAEGAVIGMNKNPIDSPDAIIVEDASSTEIKGAITGSPVAFTFAYDSNVQGGRTVSTDAAVAVRAIGSDTAQYVETTGDITEAVGLSFQLNAARELNYSNP